MKITKGTNRFTSFEAAVRYYSAYEGKSARQAATRKLKDGEIRIGKPILQPGETPSIIKGEGRYAITSGN